MKRFKLFIISLGLITALYPQLVFSQSLRSPVCLKVKIFSKTRSISFADKGKFVVHFQITNCGALNVPIDFYGNLGYPKDSTCNIYFLIFRMNNRGQYVDYAYDTVDYKNVIDSMIWLYPGKIYTFYLPLFQIYDIKEPGSYRIQGVYRMISPTGEFYIQKSDYFDVTVD